MRLVVERAEVDDLLDVRQPVLRPGKPRDAARFDGDAGGRHWVARLDGRAIGCATVLDAPLRGGPRWQLRGMAVLADAQRLGVGRALLDVIARDVGEAMWCNAREAAIPFYRAVGWSVISAPFEVPGIGPHRRMVTAQEAHVDEVLATGRFLRLMRRDGWEMAQRVRASGVVGVIAVTPGGGLLLVEQRRPPLGGRVIELPAGLAGDLADAPDEAMVEAAKRELMEETGYEAATWTHVAGGPVTAGLTDEQIELFLARDLTRTGPGGGDSSEDICVHEAPLADVHAWLAARAAEGVHLDTKVFVALFFLGVAWDGRTTFTG